MIAKNLLTFSMLCLSFFCSYTLMNTDQAKLLQKKWKPVQMEFNGKLEKEVSPTNKSMEFRANGEFWVDNEQEGNWVLADNEKQIIIRSHEASEDMVFVINKLTKKELIISISKDGDAAKIYLIPA